MQEHFMEGFTLVDSKLKYLSRHAIDLKYKLWTRILSIIHGENIRNLE